MVTHFFSDCAAIERMHEGSLGCYVDCFAQQLFDQHFSRGSARAQVLDVANLSRWLSRHHLKAEDLDSNTIDKYLQHQPRRCRCRRGHRAALLRLLSVLHERGIAVSWHSGAQARTPSLPIVTPFAYCFGLRSREAPHERNHLSMPQPSVGSSTFRADSGRLCLTLQ